jgi:hypothetical protein
MDLELVSAGRHRNPHGGSPGGSLPGEESAIPTQGELQAFRNPAMQDLQATRPRELDPYARAADARLDMNVAGGSESAVGRRGDDVVRALPQGPEHEGTSRIRAGHQELVRLNPCDAEVGKDWLVRRVVHADTAHGPAWRQGEEHVPGSGKHSYGLRHRVVVVHGEELVLALEERGDPESALGIGGCAHGPADSQVSDHRGADRRVSTWFDYGPFDPEIVGKLDVQLRRRFAHTQVQCEEGREGRGEPRTQVLVRAHIDPEKEGARENRIEREPAVGTRSRLRDSTDARVRGVRVAV